MQNNFFFITLCYVCYIEVYSDENGMSGAFDSVYA